MRFPTLQITRALALAAALAGCGEVSSAAPEPASIDATPVAPSKALAGGTVPVEVRVNTAAGGVLADVQVAFRLEAGGGALADAIATTDASGTARTAWTLGAGENVLVAEVPGTGVAHTIRVTAPEVVLAFDSADVTKHFAGLSVGYRVRLADKQGKGIPGVAVAFAVKAGETATPTQAVTDENGHARTAWTLGPLGMAYLTASVPGTPMATGTYLLVEAPRRVDFGKEALVLRGIGCDASVLATIYNGSAVAVGDFVSFRLTTPGLVQLSSTIYGTGSYRGMSAILTGASPGVTSLIASHRSGSADTLRVEVQPNTPTRLDFGPVVQVGLGVGDTVRKPAAVLNGCSRTIADAPISYAVTDPRVAEVTASGVMRALAAGATQVIATSGALADTVELTVRRIVVTPADTTVFVGDTLRYAAAAYDANGARIVPQYGVGMSTPDHAVAGFLTPPGRAGSHVATALAPGTVQISAFLDGYRGSAVLRVRARP